MSPTASSWVSASTSQSAAAASGMKRPKRSCTSRSVSSDCCIHMAMRAGLKSIGEASSPIQ
jgi:hypothetical protein